ncbi:MAG: Wzz/FepE/Etk N-terminal domain-containing protein, partial [Bacteroidota bacterium]
MSDTLDNHIPVASKEKGDSIGEIDFDKVKSVLRKNIIWIILIIALTNVAAYLTIRWTKPFYQSDSQIKLDIKSEASALGINNLVDQTIDNISGEIELIQSRLFFDKVIDAVDIGISYHTIGNILTDEKYKQAPFSVEYSLENPGYYNRRIYVTILDKNTFQLSLKNDDDKEAKSYEFGEKIALNGLELSIKLSEAYIENSDNAYFFIIHSRAALLDYLQKNTIVQPLNLNAKTIRISFKDHNPLKAHDLVNAIDTLYLKYSDEEKNRANKQKIDWLDGELKQIEGRLEQFENYFENFTITNKTTNLKSDVDETIKMINELDSQRFVTTRKIGEVKDLRKKIALDQEILVRQSFYPANIIRSLEELSTLVSEREKLSLSYTEVSFTVQKKEQEISLLKQSIEKQLKDLEDQWTSELEEL